MITIKCPSCGHENRFDQPYPIHAGFSNDGFLYNDDGNLTLVWSTFDHRYRAVIGEKHPWTLDAAEQSLLERELIPAPRGGRWRFVNPARCNACKHSISAPITQTIYYLLFPGSVITDLGLGKRHFDEVLVTRTDDGLK